MRVLSKEWTIISFSRYALFFVLLLGKHRGWFQSKMIILLEPTADSKSEVLVLNLYRKEIPT